MFLTFYDHERREVSSATSESLNGELEKVPLMLVLEDPVTFVPHYVGALVFRTIPFGETTCVVGHRHLNFLRSPLPGSRTESQKSAAQYWIVHQLDEWTLLLLQYLPRGSQTTVHWHRDETETFYCLLGHCLLMEGRCDPADARDGAVKERWHRLQARGPVQTARIAPRVVHQLATPTGPALNLIIIEGTAARTLAELDHQHTQWKKRSRPS